MITGNIHKVPPTDFVGGICACYLALLVTEEMSTGILQQGTNAA
ncbi:hypothetical protein [Paenibacillus popilliae]|nr:hypothetical protein [Paenibacillus sp. SDF0028]